jgi:hypothetical protein
MARHNGPAPYAWKFKDLVDHQRHRSFLVSRAQANFRQEGFDMSMEEYFSLWTPELWHQRGRASDDLCMVRRDIEKPWSKDNCLIVTRYWQIARGKKSHKIGKGSRQI